ncbi:hypothetical protein BC833DRAFT_593544 [Globomyces pollinis-pini]|nr:hypothetical protein BC833DRAFT_593544 [Globomyces pollinis-pini]
MLKDAGAKINIRDAQNNTPLHLAIEGDQGETAVYLIEQNGDVDALNKEGKTPLQMTDNQTVLKFIKKAIEG